MAAFRFTCVGFSPKIDWKSVEFMSPLPVYRICSVCGVVPNAIYSLECGHVFCTSCTDALTSSGTYGSCPFDKRPFEASRVSRDASSEDFILHLKVFCMNKDNGCPHSSVLSSMLDHYYGECTFHSVQCRVCKNEVVRKDILDHVRDCRPGSDDWDGPQHEVHAGAGDEFNLRRVSSDILTKIDNLQAVFLRKTDELQALLIRNERGSDAREPSVVQTGTEPDEQPVSTGDTLSASVEPDSSSTPVCSPVTNVETSDQREDEAQGMNGIPGTSSTSHAPNVSPATKKSGKDKGPAASVKGPTPKVTSQASSPAAAPPVKNVSATDMVSKSFKKSGTKVMLDSTTESSTTSDESSSDEESPPYKRTKAAKSAAASASAVTAKSPAATKEQNTSKASDVATKSPAASKASNTDTAAPKGAAATKSPTAAKAPSSDKASSTAKGSNNTKLSTPTVASDSKKIAATSTTPKTSTGTMATASPKVTTASSQTPPGSATVPGTQKDVASAAQTTPDSTEETAAASTTPEKTLNQTIPNGIVDKSTETEFLWEVKPYWKLRSKVTIFKPCIFYSDTFYIGENGYKARLEGRFHEVDSEVVLGLYVHLVKGPHDSKLQWPFRRSCAFVLLHTKHHQRDLRFALGENMTEEEKHNLANNFNRPKSVENDAVGIEHCLSAARMKQGGFVKNNTFRVQFVTCGKQRSKFC